MCINNGWSFISTFSSHCLDQKRNRISVRCPRYLFGIWSGILRQTYTQMHKDNLRSRLLCLRCSYVTVAFFHCTTNNEDRDTQTYAARVCCVVLCVFKVSPFFAQADFSSIGLHSRHWYPRRANINIANALFLACF